jgi:hypothetical protein
MSDSTATITVREEQWRDIPGFEGLYQVSDHGRVKSLDRTIHRRSSTACPEGYTMVRRGKIMSPHMGTHSSLPLMKDGKRITAKISRLVMLAFVGPSKLSVLHKDCNRINDRLDNLVYATSKEIAEHLRLHGLYDARTKVSDEAAAAILESTEAHVVLAERYGVTPAVIHSIRAHNHKKHVPGTSKYISPIRMTPEIVREIRASDELLTVLAERYGFDQSNISLIRNRKRWAHVV